MVAGKGLTGIGLFLTDPIVMRPCDGMCGLVRGNRRTLPDFPNKTAGRSVVAIRRGRHVWNLPHTSGLSGSLSRFSWFGRALVTRLFP